MGCNLDEADMRGADLTGTTVSKENIDETIMHDTGLSHKWVTWAGSC